MPTEINNLGEFEREFDTNHIARYLSLIIAVGFIGGALYMAFLAIQSNEPVIWILIGFMSVLFIFLGILMIRRFRNNRGGTIRLYENGLDVTINDKRYLGNWDDIEIVQEIMTENRLNGIHVSDTYSYFVRLKDGECFLLDSTFFGVKEIGARICDETFARLYPKFSKQIETGEKVEFGDVILNSSGLTVKNKLFLWTFISAFTIEKGNLIIKDKNGKKIWSEIYANIPNAHVLIVILDDFIKK